MSAGLAKKRKQAEDKLTVDEAELYDRQIRLWGAAAQQRLQAASFLYIGITGLATEMLKNVILAGVNHVTLMDGQLSTLADCASNFFIDSATGLGVSRAEASRARAQLLNERVDVRADPSPAMSKDQTFFRQFSIVVLCNQSPATALYVSTICRSLDIPCVVAGTYGGFACAYFDVSKYSYIRKNSKEIQTSQTTPYSSALETSWAHFPDHRRKRPPVLMHAIHVLWRFIDTAGRLPTAGDAPALIETKDQLCQEKGKDGKAWITDEMMVELAKQARGEIAVVGAVAGGVISQETLKIISTQNGPMFGSFLCYSMTEGRVQVFKE